MIRFKRNLFQSGAGVFPAAVFCGALLFSCATSRPFYPETAIILPPSGPLVWEEVFPGAEEALLHLKNPPVRAWAYRIDLSNPHLEVFVTPGLDSAEASSANFAGRYTSSAAREFGLDLTLNGSPFTPFVFSEGSIQHVIGLSLSAGEVFSCAHKKYAAALFSENAEGGYTVSLQYRPFVLDNVSEALGGFFMILKDGRPLITDSMERNPLTLLGTDTAGRFLYLLIVDGRQPRWSTGLNLQEAALWLSRLGASGGMNLDGGGSVALVRRSGNTYRVMNRPVDFGITRKQRVVPNHLGFRFYSCSPQ